MEESTAERLWKLRESLRAAEMFSFVDLTLRSTMLPLANKLQSCTLKMCLLFHMPATAQKRLGPLVVSALSLELSQVAQVGAF